MSKLTLQIRQTEELPPIAHDSNIDVAYQDFRRLPQSVHSMPGDRLIAECIYDSSSRKAITLGKCYKPRGNAYLSLLPPSPRVNKKLHKANAEISMVLLAELRASSSL